MGLIKDSLIGGIVPGSVTYSLARFGSTFSSSRFVEAGLCGAVIDASTYLLYESAFSNSIGHDLISYNTDFLGNNLSPLEVACGIFFLRAGTYIFSTSFSK